MLWLYSRISVIYNSNHKKSKRRLFKPPLTRGRSSFPSVQPFAKIQQFFFPASLFLKKSRKFIFSCLFALLPVPLREYSSHIFLARQHRLQQLAQRRYAVRAIAHKFLVYRTHCIDYIVHQRACLECRIPCLHLNYELSIL